MNGTVRRWALTLAGTAVIGLVAASAWAQDVVPPYRVAYPVVASAPGVSGDWKTELVLVNMDTVDVMCSINYYPRDDEGGNALTVQRFMSSGEMLVFHDLLPDVFKLSSVAGAITVRAMRMQGGSLPAKFTSRVRVYNDRGEAVFGQGLGPQTVTDMDTTAALFFPGVERSADRYTNIAVMNVEDDPVTAVMKVTDDMGSQVGSKLLTIDNCIFLTDVLAQAVGGSADGRFNIRIEVPGRNAPLAAVASIVERGSGDATTVEPLRILVETDED
jgi:hypothetical protein